MSIEETNELINKLTMRLDRRESSVVKEWVGNELRNYVSPKHNKNLVSIVWDIEEAIRNRKWIKIKYKKANGIEWWSELIQKGVIYSEYYFYLIADKEEYTNRVYRIDRINCYKILEKTFMIGKIQAFQEGKFRKSLQFMQKDDLIKTKFQHIGKSVEAILDRGPTDTVIKAEEGKFLLEAKVHKKGIKMWFLSQGKNIKVIEPRELVE